MNFWSPSVSAPSAVGSQAVKHCKRSMPSPGTTLREFRTAGREKSEHNIRYFKHLGEALSSFGAASTDQLKVKTPLSSQVSLADV